MRCPRLQLRSLSAVTSAVWLGAYGLFVLCQVPSPRPAWLLVGTPAEKGGGRLQVGPARRCARVPEGACWALPRRPGCPRALPGKCGAARGSERAAPCPVLLVRGGSCGRTAAVALPFWPQRSFPWNEGRKDSGSQLAVVRYAVATACCRPTRFYICSCGPRVAAVIPFCQQTGWISMPVTHGCLSMTTNCGKSSVSILFVCCHGFFLITSHGDRVYCALLAWQSCAVLVKPCSSSP